MKNRVRLTEQDLHKVIKETVENFLTEGAGSAYTVEFDGLKAEDFKLMGKENRGGDTVIKFVGKLVPTEVEWRAEGYYDGVTSEGIYYDGELVDEFDSESKMVSGGEIRGCVFVDDVVNGDEPLTRQDVKDYLNDNLSDFKISSLYGGGWSHVNLSNPIELEDLEVSHGDGIGFVVVDKIQIDAHGIVEAVNWFFENVNYFDEIFGENETEEEDFEEK